MQNIINFLSINEDEEDKTLSFGELRAKYLQIGKSKENTIITNIDTNDKIVISHTGINEWRSKSKSREQIISIKYIDQLLKKAKRHHSAPDKKGRKEIECFDYYYCPIFINGNGYNAIISVEKTRTAGNLYYHHFLKDIKIEPFSSIPPDTRSNALLLNDS